MTAIGARTWRLERKKGMAALDGAVYNVPFPIRRAEAKCSAAERHDQPHALELSVAFAVRLPPGQPSLHQTARPTAYDNQIDPESFRRALAHWKRVAPFDTPEVGVDQIARSARAGRIEMLDRPVRQRLRIAPARYADETGRVRLDCRVNLRRGEGRPLGRFAEQVALTWNEGEGCVHGS